MDKRRELAFAGAGLFGIVMYFMLENTALTLRNGIPNPGSD